MKLSLIILAAVFKMVVIPVQFTDRSLDASSSEISDRAALVQNYFNDQLGANRSLSVAIAPTVTLSHKLSYYGANYSDRRDVLLHEAVREACQKSSSVDFSRYDGDSDGTVDNIVILAAGPSEADGSGENYIWPQQGLLTNDGGTLTINGVKIDCYTAVPEASGLGVFCHEVGHALGLYDLYDTDGEASGGLSKGLWSTGLMDAGCLLYKSVPGPGFSALDMNLLGIGDVADITDGDYTLSPISTGRRYLKAATDTDGEYFLFEVRKDEGYDKGLGGSGLLVYHIDRSENAAGWSDYYKVSLNAYERWEKSQINCRPDRQCALIVAAMEDAGSTSEIFFPQEGHTSFGSDTSPAFTYWSGSSSPYALTGIRKNDDGSVSFKVIEPLRLTDISAWQDAAIIQWAADASLTPSAYTLTWSGGGRSGSVKAGASATSITVEGLEAKTTYTFRLTLRVSSTEAYSINGEFTTKSYYNGAYPYIYLNVTGRGNDGSFTSGTKIPLRVFNAKEVSSVEWYFNDTKVSAGTDGWFELTSSGTLKAVVEYDNGTTDTIIKEITVRR